jgi:LacI family transcriptional regulator
MAITIKDIASRAGVSRGTVDRVIHNRGNVAIHVRQKVENVIAELGYKRNIIASQLVSNRSLTIGVALPHFSEDPFWSLPMNGINQCFEEYKHLNIDLNVSYYNLVNEQSFTKAYQNNAFAHIDALITAPVYQKAAKQCQDYFSIRNIPIVAINTPFESQINNSFFVGSNSYQAGKTAGRLFDMQLTSPPSILTITIGQEPQLAAHFKLKEKGLADYYNGKDVHISTLQLTNLAGKGHLQNNIKNHVEGYGPFNGIFILNSKAHRFVDAMKDSIQDFTIIGFDLISENINCLRNNEVSCIIDQNSTLQGYRALKTVLDLLIFEKTTNAVEYVPIHIVLKESLPAAL